MFNEKTILDINFCSNNCHNHTIRILVFKIYKVNSIKFTPLPKGVITQNFQSAFNLILPLPIEKLLNSIFHVIPIIESIQ